MASIFPSRGVSFSPSSSPYPISFQRASSSSATIASSTTSLAAMQSRKPQSPTHPPPYNLPIPSIDAFFREVALKTASKTLTPSCTTLEPVDCLTLTLHDVPSTALPYVQRRLDYLASGPVSSAKSGKLDYNLATKTLIISCATFAHENMSRIDTELLSLLHGNDRAFHGAAYRDDPAMQIVAAGSAAIPLAFAPGLTRQPDGSLRVLGHPLPFMVWEILDHMPLSDMPRKLKDYFAGTRGKVRFVIIIKLERQPPPRKRKRAKSDDEDAGDAHSDVRPPGREDGDDTHRIEEREQAPLSDQPDEDPSSPPPVGSLIRGVFWVYGCQRTATPTNANSSRIIALETEQEFYPRRPTSSLQLHWSDILSGAPVPRELADKVVSIPYAFLHDRFRSLVDAQTVMLPDAQAGEDLSFDIDQAIPGLSEQQAHSESETSASEDEGARGDPTFRSRAIPVAGVERRVTRLMVREAEGAGV